MVELMIALRKSKDLESVWLFNRVLVRMDFDFRLMSCRYSGEKKDYCHRRQQAFMHFSTASWAWNSAGLLQHLSISSMLYKPRASAKTRERGYRAPLSRQLV